MDRSAQKSELLQYYVDATERIAALEASLKYTEELAIKLQGKLDGNAAEYFKEKKTLQDAKDAVVADNNSLLKQKTELLEKNKKLR